MTQHITSYPQQYRITPNTLSFREGANTAARGQNWSQGFAIPESKLAIFWLKAQFVEHFAKVIMFRLFYAQLPTGLYPFITPNAFLGAGLTR